MILFPKKLVKLINLESNHYGWSSISARGCLNSDVFRVASWLACTILIRVKAAFSSRNEIFWISHRMFQGCQKGFSDTNKKTNYIARLKTARRIY